MKRFKRFKQAMAQLRINRTAKRLAKFHSDFEQNQMNQPGRLRGLALAGGWMEFPKVDPLAGIKGAEDGTLRQALLKVKHLER